MNSAENVSVKPCPFCGTEPTMVHGATDDYQIVCRGRGCFGPVTSGYAFSSDAIAAWNLLSPPTEDADRVEAVAWGSGTIDRLQRAIMDDDEAVRERAAENVAVLYAHSVAPYAAALAMVREAIGELFGPKASMESEDATLLRGPEPHHEAEAQIAALRRVYASLRPETVGTSEAMVERAQTHAIALEQCSIFVDSPHLKSAMTEAAAFLRSISPQEGK